MPGFSKLDFQVSEHATHLLNSFSDLRRHGNILTDCTLSISGVEFPIHKCFLAACSPYFRALFTSEMREKTSSLIKIRGIEPQTFQLVLDFLYSGRISLDENNVIEVYPAAQLLQLDLLRKICCDYFINQLCASNCIGIWKFARTYNDRLLETAAWEYLITHLMELVKCEEFLNMESRDLCELLSSNELDLSSEMDCYSVVTAWLNHDFNSRQKSILSLISCVRFPLLPPSSLNSLLSTDHIITSDRKLKDVLIQARNAQRLRCTKYRQKNTNAFQKMKQTPRKSKRSLSVVGGYSGDYVKVCETLDDATASWVVDELELSPCEHVHWAGVIGYRIYAIGGDSLLNINRVWSKLTPHASNLLQTSALSKEWECEATLPSDCSSMQFCTMDECIYGCGQTTLDGNVVYGITRYNPGSGSHEFLTALPNPRVSMGFLAQGGILYLVGGIDPDSGTALTLCEGYSPHSGCWERFSNLKIGRYHLGAVVLDRHIYVLGGIGDAERDINTQLKSVERYSLDTLKWTFVSSLPVAKAAMAACAWRGKIYCVGGEAGDEVHTRDVFSFSPTDEKWCEIKSLKLSRIHPNIVVT